MGASNIDIIIKGKATDNEILKAFDDRRKRDSEQNGHCDGYSGDFQTVQDVKIKTGVIFPDANTAYNYCLEHAQKWEYVIAVHFKTKAGDTNTLIAGWGAD